MKYGETFNIIIFVVSVPRLVCRNITSNHIVKERKMIGSSGVVIIVIILFL